MTRTQRLLPLGACLATLLAVILLGNQGRRAVQVMALALPLMVWLLWPVRAVWLHRLRGLVVGLWAMTFVVDSVVRAYLLAAYQAAPDSAFIVGAAANTGARESLEYLRTEWRALAVWSGVMLAAALVLARYAPRGARSAAGWPRRAVAVMGLLLLVSALGFVSKPWRSLHPVLFWSQWAGSVQALRSGWADQQGQRDQALARARAAAPVVTRAGPSTVVLVINESINRDDMSLYGYGRATTPRLAAQKAQLRERMLVLRKAWSVDATTLPSLHNILRFGEPDDRRPHHLLALARAAGYRTWWLSNHDDIGIEQQHGRMADVVEMINRVPGRSGASLDGELLDHLRAALEDPAERKLVVVHLLGAHPHYSLRYPAGANPFAGATDGVEADLKARGRFAWVRKYREEYDAAILYSDFVSSETLRLAAGAGRPDGYRAWMLLSDHGQEVGHTGNQVGHSPQTASGYRIPAIVWRSGPPWPLDAATLEARPFRADWAGWTLVDLLNIHWSGDATDRDLLARNYRWQAPVLPAAVATFDD